MSKGRIPGAARNGIVPRSAIERLHARLRPADGGCLVWTGALDRKGYARIAIGGQRNAMGHRIAYEAAKGPIPGGLTLDHLCRNPACCNPDHLEPVTSAENNARAAHHRSLRTECKNGHPYTPASTQISPGGVKFCRICRRERQARAREAANAITADAEGDAR